ncbi:unnamed protein product [Linum trigynum]|uniref:Uncharacterized protein n=1 Tax=Linum trigynum TaxID=586398 RepID=A0AAV2E446_9ROSI
MQNRKQEVLLPHARLMVGNPKKGKSPRGFALKKSPNIFGKRKSLRSPRAKDHDRGENSQVAAMRAAPKAGQEHGQTGTKGLRSSARQAITAGETQRPTKKLIRLREKEASGVPRVESMKEKHSFSSCIENHSDGENASLIRETEATRRRRLILEDDSDDDFQFPAKPVPASLESVAADHVMLPDPVRLKTAGSGPGRKGKGVKAADSPQVKQSQPRKMKPKPETAGKKGRSRETRQTLSAAGGEETRNMGRGVLVGQSSVRLSP